jgi:hypothetical protein
MINLHGKIVKAPSRFNYHTYHFNPCHLILNLFKDPFLGHMKLQNQPYTEVMNKLNRLFLKSSWR